ncbi:MAG: DUF4388 domain-containing protein [Acidobacteriota bacterium]
METSAGSFRGRLKALSIADILAFLRTLNRRGLLTATAGGASVDLYLRDGRVVHAASTRESDRLSEVLLRWGLIARAQHAEAMRRAASGERLGTALLSSGALTPRGLMEARRRHVRQIALSLFEWDDGEFTFIESEEPPDDGITVDLDILDLVVDGIRSVRDAGLFRRRLPSPEWVFAPIPEEDLRRPVDLEPQETYVLGLVDGRRDVRTITSLSEFPEEESLRVLFLLFAIGYLRMEPSASERWDAPPVESLGPIVRHYNELFGRVHRYFMKQAGPISEHLLDKALREMQGRHPVLLGGARPGGDGTIDCDLVLDNLRGIAAARRREALVDGLNELLYGQLLVLRKTLGAEHERRVLRSFGRLRPPSVPPSTAGWPRAPGSRARGTP